MRASFHASHTSLISRAALQTARTGKSRQARARLPVVLLGATVCAAVALAASYVGASTTTTSPEVDAAESAVRSTVEDSARRHLRAHLLQPGG